MMMAVVVMAGVPALRGSSGDRSLASLGRGLKLIDQLIELVCQ